MTTFDNNCCKPYSERLIVALNGYPSTEDLNRVTGLETLRFSSFDNLQKLFELHDQISKGLSADIGDILLIERRYYYKAKDKSSNTVSCKETAYVYYKDRCEVQKWVNGKPIFQWLDGLFYDDHCSHTLARGLTPPPGVMNPRYYLSESNAGILELIALNGAGETLYYQSSKTLSNKDLLKDIIKMEKSNKSFRTPAKNPPNLESLSKGGKRVVLSGKIGSRIRTFYFENFGLLSNELLMPEDPYLDAMDMLAYGVDFPGRNGLLDKEFLNTNKFLDRTDMADIVTNIVEPLCKTNTWKSEKESAHFSLWDFIRAGMYQDYLAPEDLADIWDRSPEVTPQTVVGHAIVVEAGFGKEPPRPYPQEPERIGTPDEIFETAWEIHNDMQEKNPNWIVSHAWFVLMDGEWTRGNYLPEYLPGIETLARAASGWAGNHRMSIRVDTEAFSWTDYDSECADDEESLLELLESVKELASGNDSDWNLCDQFVIWLDDEKVEHRIDFIKEDVLKFDDPATLVNYYKTLCDQVKTSIHTMVVVQETRDVERISGEVSYVPHQQVAYAYYRDTEIIQKWEHGQIVSLIEKGVPVPEERLIMGFYDLNTPPGVAWVKYSLYEDEKGELHFLIHNNEKVELYYQSTLSMPLPLLYEHIVDLEDSDGLGLMPQLLAPVKDKGKEVLVGYIGDRVRNYKFENFGKTSKKLFLTKKHYREAMEVITGGSMECIKEMADIISEFVAPYCKTPTYKNEDEARAGRHFGLWDFVLDGNFSPDSTPQEIAAIYDRAHEITGETIIGHSFVKDYGVLQSTPERSGTVSQLLRVVEDVERKSAERIDHQFQMVDDMDREKPWEETAAFLESVLIGLDDDLLESVWYVQIEGDWHKFIQDDEHATVEEIDCGMFVSIRVELEDQPWREVDPL